MGRTDIHFHILPCIDDGARTLEIALGLYRTAVKDGTTHVVATPHANFEYEFDPEKNASALALMREELPELSVTLGCEMRLTYENIEDAIARPQRYTFGETNYLLVEFGDYDSPHNMERPIFRLHSAGLRTIVAHPERNPSFLGNANLVERFRDLGCIMQVTADSLTGSWGSTPRKYAEMLLKKGWVDVIASDAHSLQRRPPVLSKAEEIAAKIIGAKKAHALFDENPAAIVAGKSLP